jgi:hypothetical protein
MCWTCSEPNLYIVEPCKTVHGAICNKRKNSYILEKDENLFGGDMYLGPEENILYRKFLKGFYCIMFK